MADYRRNDEKLNFRVVGSAAYDVRRKQLPEVQLPEERALPQQKHAARAAVSPVVVLGIAVVAFLAVLILFCYVRIYETDMAIASLQTQLSELKESHDRLEGIYESQKDMLELTRHAEKLGMHRITEADIVYLDLRGADHASVTPVEKHNVFSTVIAAVRSSFRDFLEYLS